MINYIDRMGEHCHQHNDCCEHHYREHILEGEHCEEEHGFHEILLAHIHRKNIHASIEEITDLVNKLIEEKLGSAGSVDVDSLRDELHAHLNNLPKKLSQFDNDVPFLKEQDLTGKYVTFTELYAALDNYTGPSVENPNDKYSYIESVTKNEDNQIVIKLKLSNISGTDTFTIDLPSGGSGGSGGGGGAADKYAYVSDLKVEDGKLKLKQSSTNISGVKPEYEVTLPSATSIPLASDQVVGGFMTGYSGNAGYPVALSEGRAYVYIPGNNPGGGSGSGTPSGVYGMFVTVYISSDTTPGTPTGGSYNFETMTLTPPDGGWSVTRPTSGKCWKSHATFYSDGAHTDWTTPELIINAEDITFADTYTYGVALYYGTDMKTAPAKPNFGNETVDNIFDYNNRVIYIAKIPTGWSSTVPTGKKYVYVSYNNYLKKDTTYWETGWTSPFLYQDIQAILNRAETYSQTIAQSLIANAKSDLENAHNTLAGKVAENEQLIAANSATITSLAGENIQGAISGIVKLYSWLVMTTTPSNHDYECTTVQELETTYSGIDYIDKIAKVGSAYYQYTASSLSIENRVTNVEEKTGELSTAVQSIRGDEIRQQISQQIENGVITSAIKQQVNNIQLGVAQGTDENNIDKKATFLIGVLDGESMIEASAAQIVLNGDTIAEAIATKLLNVNDKTYITKEGELYTCQGTTGATEFYKDGRIILAGGKIEFNKDDEGKDLLSVHGAIYADKGTIGTLSNGTPAWTIGTTDDTSAIVGESQSGNKIVMTPESLSSEDKDGNERWGLRRDGTGHLANGKILWDVNGNLYFTNLSSITYLVCDISKQDSPTITKPGIYTYNSYSTKSITIDIDDLLFGNICLIDIYGTVPEINSNNSFRRYNMYGPAAILDVSQSLVPIVHNSSYYENRSVNDVLTGASYTKIIIKNSSLNYFNTDLVYSVNSNYANIKHSADNEFYISGGRCTIGPNGINYFIDLHETVYAVITDTKDEDSNYTPSIPEAYGIDEITYSVRRAISKQIYAVNFGSVCSISYITKNYV